MYFDRLGVIYDSQSTNRSAAGEGGSARESSLLPIGRRAMHFLIAIRIRVNILLSISHVQHRLTVLKIHVVFTSVRYTNIVLDALGSYTVFFPP